MRSVLFICWDGPQVYYLEGLFLPILKGLQEEYSFHVLQFTWGDEVRSSRIKEQCMAAGIGYTRYTITRKPSITTGTIWSLAKGIRLIRDYVRKNTPDIVMYRGTFPSFMGSRALRHNRSVRKVMDADGLPLEERVDFAGLNPRGLQYKFLKKNEGRAIGRSDAVLVRTFATIDVLAPNSAIARKFHVVLNGRDSTFFVPPSREARRSMRAQLGVKEEELLLVYSGSLGPQYCIPEMLTLFEALQRREGGARFLVLSGNPEYLDKIAILPRLKERMIVRTADFSQVPLYLGAADVGLAIRTPSHSMIGVSPVKLGEYLLSGLPVISSRRIGDTESFLSGQNAVYLLAGHGDGALQEAALWTEQVIGVPEIAGNARRIGLAHFSLEKSIESYREAFKHLL